MIIQQGTVGQIEDFSVGVKNIFDDDAGNATAHLAVWNPSRPQTMRNDYNVTLKVKTGDEFIVGDSFYRAAEISDTAVELEDAGARIDLSGDTVTVPAGAVLELHGQSIEIVSIAPAEGKTAAQIEIYSNDYPKRELEQKNAIENITAHAGDEIAIGGRTHAIGAIYSDAAARRGVLEISALPVQ